MASATTDVWISAIAAVSSELVREPGLDDRGRHDLGMRAHQQDRGAEFAHARNEQQQPGRDQARAKQRRR